MSDSNDNYNRYVTINNAMILIALVLIMGMCTRSFGQEMPTAPAYNVRVHIGSLELAAEDSVDLCSVDQMSIVEAVHVIVDTATNKVASFSVGLSDGRTLLTSVTVDETHVRGSVVSAVATVPTGTAARTVRLHLVPTASDVMTGQYRIIIVWRPLF